MSQATLYNHKGAREVTIDELSLIDAPPATETWYPVKHSLVLDTVAGTQQVALRFGNAMQFQHDLQSRTAFPNHKAR